MTKIRFCYCCGSPLLSFFFLAPGGGVRTFAVNMGIYFLYKLGKMGELLDDVWVFCPSPIRLVWSSVMAAG